jgi:hypothetical protein
LYFRTPEPGRHDLSNDPLPNIVHTLCTGKRQQQGQAQGHPQSVAPQALLPTNWMSRKADPGGMRAITGAVVLLLSVPSAAAFHLQPGGATVAVLFVVRGCAAPRARMRETRHVYACMNGYKCILNLCIRTHMDTNTYRHTCCSENWTRANRMPARSSRLSALILKSPLYNFYIQ